MKERGVLRIFHARQFPASGSLTDITCLVSCTCALFGLLDVCRWEWRRRGVCILAHMRPLMSAMTSVTLRLSACDQSRSYAHIWDSPVVCSRNPSLVNGGAPDSRTNTIVCEFRVQNWKSFKGSAPVQCKLCCEPTSLVDISVLPNKAKTIRVVIGLF